MLGFVFSFILCASTPIERYEVVHIEKPVSSNMFAASQDVSIRLLDVPAIYEIRDFDLVESKISLEPYTNDVLMSKLQPRQVVNRSPQYDDDNPFTRFDIQDIVIPTLGYDDQMIVDGSSVNPMNINDVIVYNMNVNGMPVNNMNANAMNVKQTNVRNITINVIDITITDDVYAELERMKDEYKFSEEYIKYGSKVQAYLKDLMNLDEYSRYSWIQVLKSNRTLDIDKIKAKRTYAIMAEVRLEKNDYDRQLFEKNLVAIKNLGYDSVVLRFDTSENVDKLIEVADIIKSHDIKIFMTYVGLDNQKPSWNPFADRYRLENFFSQLAPKSEGILLNWRSTSSHVKLLPKEYFNYICSLSRRYNPEILIYGEVFYGQIDYLHEKALVYTVPENITGILINNMGYSEYNQTYIVNKLFLNLVPGYISLDKIGQVIGYAPYYCSKKNLNFSLEKEYKYKKRIEKKFNRVDCSTLTFLHDGVDDNYVIDGIYNTTDNLMVDTKISTITNK